MSLGLNGSTPPTDSVLPRRSGLSKRDQYILSYAEYLRSDPTLWRITLPYMYSCGDIGKEQGDEILMRVPLRLHEQKTKVPSASGEVEGIVGTLKDLNQMCFDYGREAARRAMCRVSGSHVVPCHLTVTMHR